MSDLSPRAGSWVRKEVLAEGVELYLGDCREVLPALSLGGGRGRGH